MVSRLKLVWVSMEPATLCESLTPCLLLPPSTVSPLISFFPSPSFFTHLCVTVSGGCTVVYRPNSLSPVKQTHTHRLPQLICVALCLLISLLHDKQAIKSRKGVQHRRRRRRRTSERDSWEKWGGGGRGGGEEQRFVGGQGVRWGGWDPWGPLDHSHANEKLLCQQQRCQLTPDRCTHAYSQGLCRRVHAHQRQCECVHRGGEERRGCRGAGLCPSGLAGGRLCSVCKSVAVAFCRPWWNVGAVQRTWTPGMLQCVGVCVRRRV